MVYAVPLLPHRVPISRGEVTTLVAPVGRSLRGGTVPTATHAEDSLCTLKWRSGRKRPN